MPVFLNILIIIGAVLGFGMTFHFFYSEKKLSAKLLGLFAVAISIVSLEPLQQFTDNRWNSTVEVFIGSASFMLGPSLFLYIKYKTKPLKWRKSDSIHFLTPFVIILLLTFGRTQTIEQGDDIHEVIFYVLFNIQLYAYTITAILKAFQKNKELKKTLKVELEGALLKPLVISALILFTYSFLTTFIPMGDKSAITTFIQLFLLAIIMIIALLNAETLENHHRVVK